MTKLTLQQLLNRSQSVRQMCSDPNPEVRKEGERLLPGIIKDLEDFEAEVIAQQVVAQKECVTAIEDIALIVAKADAIVSGKPWASC